MEKVILVLNRDSRVLSDLPRSFADLKHISNAEFGISCMMFKYLDEEEDLITITTEEEYSEAMKQPILTIELIPEEISHEDKSSETLPIHFSNSKSGVSYADFGSEGLKLSNKRVGANIVTRKDVSSQFNSELSYDVILKTISKSLHQELASSDSLKKSNSKVVHDIKCSLCNHFPIIGIRYECSECDLNLCELCEIQMEHSHPMFKHKKVSLEASCNPMQRPSTQIEIQKKIELLENLGFTDHASNMEVLIKAAYDLNKAVELLLNS